MSEFSLFNVRKGISIKLLLSVKITSVILCMLVFRKRRSRTKVTLYIKTSSQAHFLFWQGTNKARDEVDRIRETTLMKTIILFSLLSRPGNSRQVLSFSRKKNCYSNFLISKYLYFLAHIKLFHIFDHFILLLISILSIVTVKNHWKCSIPRK